MIIIIQNAKVWSALSILRQVHCIYTTRMLKELAYFALYVALDFEILDTPKLHAPNSILCLKDSKNVIFLYSGCQIIMFNARIIVLKPLWTILTFCKQFLDTLECCALTLTSNSFKWSHYKNWFVGRYWRERFEAEMKIYVKYLKQWCAIGFFKSI